MLLVGQSAKAAADDGISPTVFARLNRHGVPGHGLVIVASPDDGPAARNHVADAGRAVHRIIDLAVILVVIPYIYASVAVLKVLPTTACPARTFQLFKWIAIAAVGYCLATVMGGEPRTVVNAMVALLISVPLYPTSSAPWKRPPGASKGSGPLPRPSPPRHPRHSRLSSSCFSPSQDRPLPPSPYGVAPPRSEENWKFPEPGRPSRRSRS